MRKLSGKSKVGKLFPKLSIVLGLFTSMHGFSSDALVPAVVDVRSVGMGNTASLNAVGSNAIFHNPALLGKVQLIEIQAGGRTYFGNAFDESVQDIQGAIFESRYYSTPILTHLSAALPVTLLSYEDVETVIVPAIGYHMHLDQTLKSDVTYEDELGYLYIEERMTGGFSTIAPALAFQYDEKFAVGFAYHFGGVTGVRGTYIESGLYDSRAHDTTDGYYLSWDFRVDGNYSSQGSYIQVGVYAEPIPQISLAFTYRSPIKWGWRFGKEYVYLSMIHWDRYDGWDSLSIREDYDYDNEEAFSLPGLISLGVGAAPFSFLYLAAEYQTRPFSDFSVAGDYLDVDNGSAFRFGAELGLPVLIRAGFYREAVPKVNLDSRTPKALLGFTAGIGIPLFSVIILNGSFEYATWRQTSNQTGDYYSQDLFRFGTSIGVRFPNKQIVNPP